LEKTSEEMRGIILGATAESNAKRIAELQDRSERLNMRLIEIQQELAAEPADSADLESALHAFDPLWEQLSTWEQERFIHTLVEQIRYDGKTGTVMLGFRSTGIKDLCNWANAITEKYRNAQ